MQQRSSFPRSGLYWFLAWQPLQLVFLNLQETRPVILDVSGFKDLNVVGHYLIFVGHFIWLSYQSQRRWICCHYRLSGSSVIGFLGRLYTSISARKLYPDTKLNLLWAWAKFLYDNLSFGRLALHLLGAFSMVSNFLPKCNSFWTAVHKPYLYRHWFLLSLSVPKS